MERCHTGNSRHRLRKLQNKRRIDNLGRPYRGDMTEMVLPQCKLLGWKHGADHRAYQRYFNKFSQTVNQCLFSELFRWFFSELIFVNYTLDFDSTVMFRVGLQEVCRARGPDTLRPASAAGLCGTEGHVGGGVRRTVVRHEGRVPRPAGRQSRLGAIRGDGAAPRGMA